MVYRHALGAILLLVWNWTGDLDTWLHGHVADRLIAGMRKVERRRRALEMPMLRVHVWLFKQIERLMPERYYEPDEAA